MLTSVSLFAIAFVAVGPCFYCFYKKSFVQLIQVFVFAITVQLDGTNSKEQLFYVVYDNILNNIQKSL